MRTHLVSLRGVAGVDRKPPADLGKTDETSPLEWRCLPASSGSLLDSFAPGVGLGDGDALPFELSGSSSVPMAVTPPSC